VSWRWDFGDGGNSTDQNPAHIYAGGTYTVTLTVIDDRGQTATPSQRVTVAG
jgi:PKD repeat protein